MARFSVGTRASLALRGHESWGACLSRGPGQGTGSWGGTRPVIQRGKGADSSPMPLGAHWVPRVAGERAEPARPPQALAPLAL